MVFSSLAHVVSRKPGLLTVDEIEQRVEAFYTGRFVPDIPPEV
jgi:hypothetical protein